MYLLLVDHLPGNQFLKSQSRLHQWRVRIKPCMQYSGIDVALGGVDRSRTSTVQSHSDGLFNTASDTVSTGDQTAAIFTKSLSIVINKKDC